MNPITLKRKVREIVGTGAVGVAMVAAYLLIGGTGTHAASLSTMHQGRAHHVTLLRHGGDQATTDTASTDSETTDTNTTESETSAATTSEATSTETTTSEVTTSTTTSVKPGKGCGDKNHSHSSNGSCKGKGKGHGKGHGKP